MQCSSVVHDCASEWISEDKCVHAVRKVKCTDVGRVQYCVRYVYIVVESNESSSNDA